MNPFVNLCFQMPRVYRTYGLPFDGTLPWLGFVPGMKQFQLGALFAVLSVFSLADRHNAADVSGSDSYRGPSDYVKNGERSTRRGGIYSGVHGSQNCSRCVFSAGAVINQFV